MYFIIPLLNFIGLELVLLYTYIIYPVSALILVLTCLFIYRRTRAEHEHRATLFISAILFLASHYLFLVFIEGSFFIHSFIVLTSFLLFAFLYSVHDKHGGTQSRLNYALENIIGYFNLIVFFFLTVDIFYFHVHTNQKFGWLLFLFIVSVIAVSYTSYEVFHVATRKGMVYMGIILLIMVEIFWTTNMLPISVYSKGALLTLAYYVFLGLSKHYLIFGSAEMSRRVVARYIVISACGILTVLGTARW